MKTLGAVVAILVVVTGSTVGAQDGRATTPSHLKAAFGKLPIYFIENRGVFPDEVAYYIQGADKTLYFTKEGITFRLKGRDRDWVVKLEFVGANPDVVPRGEDRQRAVFSYFKGPEEDWKAGLPSCSKIVYRDLWPGIDLVYHGTVNKLKYEFIAASGADPKRIRLRYRGANKVSVTDNGALRVTTPEGSFEDAPPAAWQNVDGRRVQVAMRYALGKGGAFQFALGEYDRTRPLVLDPAILVYCGYLGGGEVDLSFAIAVDPAGNAYVAGRTTSDQNTFPVRVGPDLTKNAPHRTEDAFVAKVNAAGTALVYCGYIGGEDRDQASDIAVDAAGSAYLTGNTWSKQTFPVVSGPALAFNGGLTDAFVAKVDAAGTKLDYCGYIGGSGLDQAGGIAVDSGGNAYVAGSTDSDANTFPVRLGPSLYYAGGNDVFVAKVNAAGTALVYCGYIGGQSTEYAHALALDAAGNVYVAGTTGSDQQARFPLVVGPDLTYNGGLRDGFVAKVNAAGTKLDYCGYIGGSSFRDDPNGIAVDSSGNAHVVGTTSSDQQSFPVRIGPDVTFNGWEDAFVAKVASDGKSLLYCGYIGGDQLDRGYGVAVDAAGNAYVTGETESNQNTFPVRLGPDLTHNGTSSPGDEDAFIAKVNPTGTALVYCGYIGGADVDQGNDVAVDGLGCAYVTGCTCSDEKTFPVGIGPDLTHSGNFDAFVAKVPAIPYWFHATLSGTGNPLPGGMMRFELDSPGDGNLAYCMASSLGLGPIWFDVRALRLDVDGLFLISLAGLVPNVFVGFGGRLDATGKASAQIFIPKLVELLGVTVHTAFVTVSAASPSGIRSTSNSASFTIRK